MRPIIGITCSISSKREITYELPERYVKAVWQAGGIPFLLPPVSVIDTEFVSEILQGLDGIIVSGGRDIPPDLYGETDIHPKTDTDETMRLRALFEISIVKEAVKKRKSILGICYGCQLLNVAFGGSLYQDISSIPSFSPSMHKLSQLPWFVEHTVQLDSNSLLANLLNGTNFNVKSSHHQAIKTLGKGLVAIATAPDGVVEAVGSTDNRFIIGVQWHPEAQLSERHARRLFEVFVNACLNQGG